MSLSPSLSLPPPLFSLSKKINKEKMGMVGDGGIEQKGKRTHGHGQQCGDCGGEVGIRGLNGNMKKKLINQGNFILVLPRFFFQD